MCHGTKRFSELFGPVANYGEKQNIQLQNFVLVGHRTPPMPMSDRSLKLIKFIDY